MKAPIILTFDLDWSPDWMIDEIADLLAKRGIKSTWFVTHASPAVERLRERQDLVELGIHPNCLPNSSHGGDEAEAMTHMRQIVPNGVSMRTHGLYQTSAFLIRAVRDFAIKIDSSLHLPMPGLQPHELRIDQLVIRRAPFCWADDLTMRDPLGSWDFSKILGIEGLRIFNFHPFHVVLNTVNYTTYEMLKTQRPIQRWSRDFVTPHRSADRGPRSFLDELIKGLSGKRTFFLADLLEPEFQTIWLKSYP
jgi:peptidoglycan/xylan/chitin deacetylase (PgdA/CDA1 family)